jgi:hypothetical protein
MEVFMDKVWLVTGSASSLGRSIAETLRHTAIRGNRFNHYVPRVCFLAGKQAFG